MTDGSLAFIKFSKTLLDDNFPVELIKPKIVVEVQESDYQANVTIEDCRELKSKGYMQAIDGFILDDANLSLLDMADVIRIDFTAATLETQAALIEKFKNKAKFFCRSYRKPERRSK